MGPGSWLVALSVAVVLVLRGWAQEEGITIQSAEDLLITSVRTGDAENVVALLERGVSADAATEFGTTALWSACFRGYVDIVTQLVEFGADVNVANQKGTTPLFIASQKGHVEVVRILLDAGAEVDVATRLGGTPLIVASQENRPNVVELLLAAGANVDARKTKSGQTALWSASYNGHHEVTLLLLASNADVHIADEASGATPLYVSVRHNDMPIARSLISNGADVNQGIGNGFTPIHLASALGSEDGVRLLLEKGANPSILDHQGRSPIDVLGKAQMDLPQEVYDIILEMLKLAANSFPGDLQGAVLVPSPSPIKSPAKPVGLRITKIPAPSPPTAGTAGMRVLVPILAPVFGVFLLVVAVITAANVVRLRKVVREERQNPFRPGSGSLDQPMLIHNLAAAPPRGGSPRPESAFSHLSSCSSTTSSQSDAEKRSGTHPQELEVPNVQDHQPTHARGPSLHSVPVELAELLPDVTGISEGYPMHYLLERSSASSEGSQQALVFKSACMRLKPASEGTGGAGSSSAFSSSNGTAQDPGFAFRSVAMSVADRRGIIGATPAGPSEAGQPPLQGSKNSDGKTM